MKNSVKDIQPPLVSICIITYNHEKYIKQTVDSIISQKKNFSYEILIADDSSTDQTQQILIENYSNVKNIRLILRQQNIGINGYMTYQEARGKYIYLCEGDDYCVGEDSIQTLVDWLECHEEYAGVCGRRITLSERTGLMTISYDAKTDNTDICLNELIENSVLFDMCAILYRNFYSDGVYDYRYYLASKKISDITRAIYVLLHGKVFQLSLIIGVYRTDRIRNVSSYNVNNSSAMIFKEYTESLKKLQNLIGFKLNCKGLKRYYTFEYVNTLVSTYEVLKQLPYIRRMVGVGITMEVIKRRLLNNR